MRRLVAAARGTGATLLALGCLGTAPVPTLTVRVEGIIGTAGEIRVAICDRSLDEKGCTLGALRVPHGPAEEFTFPDLARGRYAVAAYHDVNGNGRLDTILGGLPVEPYGFSNDVGRTAPPSFDGAAIPIGPEPTRVTIRLRRLFAT